MGGTEIADAPKWLFGNVIGNLKKIHGSLGPKTIEVLQNVHHMVRGRFLSFLKPGLYGMGTFMFSFAIIDRQVRKAFFSYLANIIKNPFRIFKKVSVQSLLILQPQDVLANGKKERFAKIVEDIVGKLDDFFKALKS